MLVRDDQTRGRHQDSLSKPATGNFVPNEDIQFGYHSASGSQIRITSDGLGAENIHYDKVICDSTAYGARPLKGKAEFNVEIVSYGVRSVFSLGLGVMRCKKGVPIEPSLNIFATNHCVWGDQRLYNNLVTPEEESDYGYVDLDDVCVGDCVGLRLSQDGVLEFFVNGESQGIPAKNIYTRNSDVYAVVDLYGDGVATVITKAGECSCV